MTTGELGGVVQSSSVSCIGLSWIGDPGSLTLSGLSRRCMSTDVKTF
jgi:hypothetical protein